MINEEKLMEMRELGPVEYIKSLVPPELGEGQDPKTSFGYLQAVDKCQFVFGIILKEMEKRIKEARSDWWGSLSIDEQLDELKDVGYDNPHRSSRDSAWKYDIVTNVQQKYPHWLEFKPNKEFLGYRDMLVDLKNKNDEQRLVNLNTVCSQLLD